MTDGTTFFKFCPNCSSEDFDYTNNFKFHCYSCDFVLYHNIAAAVAIIFTYEDKVLFTVRNIDPDKGKLDLPGGFIDPGETAEEAACREIKEEIGLEISLTQLQYVTSSPNNYLYKKVAYRTMDIFYECSLDSEEMEITAKDEIQDLIWIKRSEIDLNKIGFISIKEVIEKHYFLEK
ncbi:NUDIX hydrolase [Flavobacterium sp.]|uniref:NUDIX hydrolase n=1 Tax=Flavobacterium sp. TaxID=239 RepID=UPI00391AB494